MGEKTQELHLDVDLETARALHRVVRALHDGECPKCHALFESPMMRPQLMLTSNPTKPARPNISDLVCPDCAFTVTHAEATEILNLFAPAMERAVDVFEQWRAQRT